MKKKTKILAINFGGIGDEILFFPTLKTLKSSFSNSSLTLVLEPRSESAKSLTNLIDNTITCDIKGQNKLFNIIKLLFKIWAGGYHVVLSSGSTKFVAILLLLTGISKKYGYDSGLLSKIILTKAVPLNKDQYAVDMYHDLTNGIEDTEKFHFSRIFHDLVSMQKCRLLTAIIASHLSKVGLEKFVFSKKTEFFRTLLYEVLYYNYVIVIKF